MKQFGFYVVGVALIIGTMYAVTHAEFTHTTCDPRSALPWMSCASR